MYPFDPDYLKHQETLPDSDPQKRLFTRIDFLRFDVKSIGSHGSYSLFKRLSPTHPDGRNDDGTTSELSKLEVEKWDHWQQFPNLQEVDSFSDPTGHCLVLLSWLVHTFGLRVYFSRLKDSDKKQGLTKEEREDALLENMTLDDFVFVFVQVQHNINKWNLIYRAWKLNHIAGWVDKQAIEYCECDKRLLVEADMKRISNINEWGYEFPAGAGVAGKDGKARYNAMTKFLYKTYYNKSDPVVTDNRKALHHSIQSHATRRRDREAAAQLNAPTVPPNKKKSYRLQELARDEELDDIQNDAWDDFGTDQITAV